MLIEAMERKSAPLKDQKDVPVLQRRTHTTTDGQEFKQLIKASLDWLQQHQSAINSLNVYPVPDGDTGTNMALTMQSAWAEIKDLPDHNVGRVAHKMAYGALMGARGNSGVILSQIWRGFSRSLDEKEVYRVEDLVAACQEATTTAYKGVVKPVEGTILTVARAVADEAARAAEETDDLVSVLEHMVLAAREAVKLTPSLLPVLAEAGVVDAGGQGLFIILDGMLRRMRGELVFGDADLIDAVDLFSHDLETVEAGYGYDVQFLIVGPDLDVSAIRETITSMGECPLVVGEPTMVKVHVHVPDPGVPISYGASLGSLQDVVVEDMQAQYKHFIAEQEAPLLPAQRPVQNIGIVAVAMGDGLVRVLESLGADIVVHGGQTMNPSTHDLLEAIDGLPTEQVILLPNNGNVILAAEQASSLSQKRVAVIPCRTIPQGIAALLAINSQADFETNVRAMTSAIEDVATGEVTVATRSVTLNGLKILDGQIIGLHNEELKVTAPTLKEATLALLRQMDSDDTEIITLYYGQDVTEDDANELAQSLMLDWPDYEIEVVAGGQPHYFYILSVE
ncbi:MAG TPA: DAK2 domain-containing protein [Chloroflexi bacterium]|nr:DAK2 domain-containing protein [Chloroflexota bacterium]